MDRQNRREFVRQAAVAGAWAVAGPSWLRAQRWLAHAPGEARAGFSGLSGGQLSLENGAIAAIWEVTPQGLQMSGIRDPGGTAALLGPWPVLGMRIQGVQVEASKLKLWGEPRIEALPPQPLAANGAERLAGRQLVVELRDPAGRFQLQWRGLLRDGSHYIRQEVAVTALGGDLEVSAVTLLELSAAGAAVQGSVAGSPVTTPEGWFLGFEHPLSHSEAAAGRVRCWLERKLPLRAGQTAVYSSVIGIAPPGQMRRAVLQYIERERAHPYRPFLHYNSWFDLGYFTPYDQAGCLEVIAAFGQELHARRGVRLDSFLFDDGWDNHKNWGFNAGFPQGFTPLQAATARWGAAPGVWLSPWGGYGPPRQERLAYGRAHGYEINRDGLALSGPTYYRLFHRACLEMVTKYGMNQFKLDGTGSDAEAAPGSAFGSDFEAALALIGDLRQAKPELYVNLTTGTYPSPFWLRYADSTWRGGEDTDFAGVGSDRQRWITYRDSDTFARVVGKGPLYPLNALMLHGIVYAKHARRLETDPQGDFDAEVRAYFGTGTQLQEMYISHGLLRPADWEVLAEAARWGRANAATLVDTHWVGGDPAQLEAYGHAAWSESNAILTLRNPSDKPQTLRLDVGAAFELPSGAAEEFVLRSPWKQDQWRRPQGAEAIQVRAGEAHDFALRPFEVLTLEAGD